MRWAAYSRGLTSRRSRSSKFFRARTTCAMLTRSWGSCKTTVMVTIPTRTVRSAECGMRSRKARSFARRRPSLHSALHTAHSALASSHQLQHAHPVHVLPISPQPHPAVAAAPDELPGAALPAGKHLVHEQIETHPPADVGALPLGPRHAERHAIPALQPGPSAPHAVRISGPVARGPRAYPPPVGLRHDQVPDALVRLPPSFFPRHVHLHSVRMDVVGLVVEPQRRRLRRAEAEVGLRDVDRQVESVVVPRGVGDGGEVLGTGVRLFAAAVLVLQLEPERLARVQIRRPSPARGRPGPSARSSSPSNCRNAFSPLGPAASSSTTGPAPSGTKRSTRETNSSTSSPAVHWPRPASPVPPKCQGSSSR